MCANCTQIVLTCTQSVSKSYANRRLCDNGSPHDKPLKVGEQVSEGTSWVRLMFIESLLTLTNEFAVNLGVPQGISTVEVVEYVPMPFRHIEYIEVEIVWLRLSM